MDLRHVYIFLILINAKGYINAASIQEELEDKYQISCNIKSVYSSINVINDYFRVLFGVDPLIKIKKKNGYYIANPLLNSGEIRYLFDALVQNKSISSREGKAIFDKLSPLFLSDSQEFEVESENQGVPLLYQLDVILNAIKENRAITFEYVQYDYDEQFHVVETVSHHGNMPGSNTTYLVSPYEITMQNSRYYLVSYCDAHPNEPTIYRIDRMSKVQRTSRYPFVDYRMMWDFERQKMNSVNMYLGTKEITLELLCDKNIFRTLIDEFGKNIDVRPTNYASKIKVTIEDVVLSDGLVGWIMMMSPQVQVLSPYSLKERIKERLLASVQYYET